MRRSIQKVIRCRVKTCRTRKYVSTLCLLLSLVGVSSGRGNGMIVQQFIYIAGYCYGPQFSAANFSKFHGPVCQIPRLPAANLPHIVIDFLWPLNPTKYAVFVTGNCNSLSTKLTGNISDKLRSIFSVFLPSKPEWQSCISWWSHVYIQYGGLNSIKICRICPHHHPVPNSAKFCENIEISWKWVNSTAQLKIPCSAENCGP